jgi:hypothetical protein
MSEIITASATETAAPDTAVGKVLYLRDIAPDNPTASQISDKKYSHKQLVTSTRRITNSDVSSFRNLSSELKTALEDAFFNITDALDVESTMAVRSNFFDEWAETLAGLSRKAETLTSHHRKILGGLIVAVGKKDISDFGKDALRVFQKATNVLRQPRVTKVERKRVIAGFFNTELRAVIGLATDNLTSDEVDQLYRTIAEVPRKSQQH